MGCFSDVLWIVAYLSAAPYARDKIMMSGRLSIEMDARQPADAPIIFKIKFTNSSRQEMVRADFEMNISYAAYLTGSNGKSRRVIVTNGSRTEGSHFPIVRLKPDESITVPFRLTNVKPSSTSPYLPSEQVYLPSGKYRLRLERRPAMKVEAVGEAEFTVVQDTALAIARWKEFANPPKGLENFYQHVLESTLTPELRKKWSHEINTGGIEQASLKVYRLSAIDSPPPDVTSALLDALRIYVDASYDSEGNRKNLAGLLNNAAYAIANQHPEGAGPVMLKLALSNHSIDERLPAIQSMVYYYEDSMRDKLRPLLKDKHSLIRFYTALALAYGGDNEAAPKLISASRYHDLYGVWAAAHLTYLPNNKEAAKALKEARESLDKKFVAKLEEYIKSLPPRKKP